MNIIEMLSQIGSSINQFITNLSELPALLSKLFLYLPAEAQGVIAFGIMFLMVLGVVKIIL